MSVIAQIVALFALIGASSASTSSRWIPVAGGAWLPDEVTMSDVASSIQTFAEANAKRLDRDLRPWAEYSFQYQGRGSKGDKYIYILALCGTVGDPDLTASFYEVMDGGTCFFGLTYDPKRKRFSHFRINPGR